MYGVLDIRLPIEIDINQMCLGKSLDIQVPPEAISIYIYIYI